MNMESREKASNDLEQYIVLDGITICLEKLQNDIDVQEKKVKKLKTLVQIQTIIIIIVIILAII